MWKKLTTKELKLLESIKTTRGFIEILKDEVMRLDSESIHINDTSLLLKDRGSVSKLRELIALLES